MGFDGAKVFGLETRHSKASSPGRRQDQAPRLEGRDETLHAISVVSRLETQRGPQTRIPKHLLISHQPC